MTAPTPTNRTKAALQDYRSQKILSGLNKADNRSLVEITAPGETEPAVIPEARALPADRIGDMTADFGAENLDGIILFDRLGRLEDPSLLFEQAQSCLKPGGRIVMIEPGLSLLSTLFYYFLDNRRIDLNHPPLENRAARHGQPGNLATASHLFNFLEHRIDLMERFPNLRCRHQEWMSILSGPLARGIGGTSLLPASFLHPLLALEDMLMPFIGRWSASQLFIVLEKRS